MRTRGRSRTATATTSVNCNASSSMIYQDAISDAPVSQTMGRTSAEVAKKVSKGKKRAAFNDLSNKNGGPRPRLGEKVNCPPASRTRSSARLAKASSSKPTGVGASTSSADGHTGSNSVSSKDIKKKNAKKGVTESGAPPPPPSAIVGPPAAPAPASVVAAPPTSSVIDLTVAEPPLPLRAASSSAMRAIDIDAEKSSEPVYASAYAVDIYAFRKEHELLYRPDGDYLKNYQEDITPNMRAILVDWLVEVAEEYNLKQETLFTSVNFIDRSLGLFQVTRHKLQLLGCACMLIAAKYEEIYAPTIEDFVYISDNTYTHDQVLRMESKVLGALKFKLTVCTPITFLSRFLRAAKAEDMAVVSGDTSEKLKRLAMYFSELGLQEYDMVHYRQSHVAAAAVALARRTLGINELWHQTLEHYTGCKLNDLAECERQLHACHRKACSDKLQAIKRKNSAPEFMRISDIEPLSIHLLPRI